MPKQKKIRKPSKLKLKIEQKKTDIALAVFMTAVPHLIAMWEEKTGKSITFDEWLAQVHKEHEKKKGE